MINTKDQLLTKVTHPPKNWNRKMGLKWVHTVNG